MQLILPRQVKKACERPPHAQWARPTGHYLFNSGSIEAWNGLIFL
jgi:hypothetical protein